MRISKCIWIIALILIYSILPASAGAAETAKAAVADGLEIFFISVSDKIFELSVSGFVNPNSPGERAYNNATVAYIYNVAAYTTNPFETTTYDNVKAFSGAVFMKGYKLVLLIAFIMLMMTHYRADIAMKINALTGMNIAQKSNMLAKKAFDGVVIAAFMYVCIFFILWFNDVLTKAVMLNMLDSIAPVPSNFILYFMMAVAYGVMMFFFGFRMLIIGLFFGFAFLIGLCLLVEPVKHTAETICAYFVQIVFFQFIIVAYFSLSILIIKSSGHVANSESFMYFIMICGGIYLGIKMMFGTGVIRWAGKTAARVV